ncbi:MAG: hypothetical protein ABII79_12640 [bacterium]
MHKYAVIIAVMGLTCLLVACGQDDPPPSLSSGLDGAVLLGLINNRTLSYLQTDTVVSIDPDYQVTVTQSQQLIRISGSGNDWVVTVADTPTINLKLTVESVIQNGYWRTVDDQDSLFYFDTPPVIMSRSPKSVLSWEGYTPAFETDTSSSARLVYNSYFGFYFHKQLVDTVRLIVPAGSYNTWHFDVNLFANPVDTIPVIRISEYYSPAVGLVRLHLQGGPLTRTLSLVEIN